MGGEDTDAPQESEDFGAADACAGVAPDLLGGFFGGIPDPSGESMEAEEVPFGWEEHPRAIGPPGLGRAIRPPGKFPGRCEQYDR